MTTRRNFLKTGSISLAGLLVGEKVYSAVSTPDNKKSFSTIASKVTGDYASKRPAPEARKKRELSVSCNGLAIVVKV